MDPANSFKAYRNAQKEANFKGASLPYLATSLRDLTFTEENPDMIGQNNNLVNFSKRELICKIIAG